MQPYAGSEMDTDEANTFSHRYHRHRHDPDPRYRHRNSPRTLAPARVWTTLLLPRLCRTVLLLRRLLGRADDANLREVDMFTFTFTVQMSGLV